MAKERFALPWDDIYTKVNSAARNCINWSESALSKERKRVLDLYEQRLPRRQSDGNSSFTSSDVYDGVEMMKAQLLETFGAAGGDILKFKPLGENDVDQARLETKCIEDVIFSDNNAFEIFHDIFDDGLKARTAVASVYWEDESTFEDHHFDAIRQEDVDAIGAMDEVDQLDATLNDGTEETDNPTYSGTFKRKVEKWRLCIEPVPPEEFYIEQRVKRRTDGTRGRRTLKTKAELMAMGLDENKIAKINWDDKSALDTAEALSRDEGIQNGVAINGDPVQPELQQVLLHVTYIKLALKGDGTAALYRALHASNVLFEIDEVEEDEFVEFAPLRRAHSWFGNNFADRLRHTQNATTVLTRGILDHTALTINPRWQIVQGGLLNPKEMIDSRMGGLVNTTRPDAIAPIPYANLNPFVFETLNLLKERKEENTGISSLSQGLNKDAISSQNSQGLVNDLVTLSQVRQKVVARFFAYSFLVPLFLKVHRELREKGQLVTVEMDGKWQTVDPSKWQPRSRLNVSLALGYGEQDKEAAKLVALYENMSKDPGTAGFFLPPQRRNLLTDAMKKNGIADFNRYVAPLEQYKPPQPDPIEQKKADAAMVNAQAAMAGAQAQSKKADVSAHHEQLRTQNDTAKIAGTLEKQQRDADRQDLDTANRIDVSQRETTLLEEAPPASEKAIVSPSS